jgi:SanA protein
LRKIIFRLARIVIYLAGAGLFVLFLPRLVTALYSLPRVIPAERAPARPIAIVFGAGLSRDGSPSPVLRDRVATAARLYFAGKVQKILMSGDNRFIYHNEPGSMKEYALELGVPDTDIVLDYAGRRTYDTCYRATSIFRVRSAILVTQAFHLPRAVYTCNVLGLDALGVPADMREYRPRSLAWWHAREIGATLVALWELHITHPLPVLGEPEPIFPLEVQ